MNPNISIVFPNWNGAKDTIKLLESLEKLNYPKKLMEIICIDNGSSDQSVKEISAKFLKMSKKWHRLHLIRLSKNIGAAGAYNRGFKMINHKTKYIWKLDNDIILDKDALIGLIKKFRISKNLGIVGSAVFPLYSYTKINDNLSGKAEIGCKINKITTIIHKKNINYEELNKIKNSVFNDIDYSIGCSNLIDLRVFQKIGYLDEDFFLYYDDSYFAYCAKKAKFEILTATDSIIYHKGSASTGGVMKPLGIYYTSLSELLYFNKTMKKWLFLLYYPFILVKRLLLTEMRLIRRWDFKLIYEGSKMYLEANKRFICQYV